jgi:hypothetical protein
MMNRYRKVLEAIRCGDPWDWEADTDEDDPAAPSWDRADPRQEYHRQARGLPSCTGTLRPELARPAA